MGPIQESARVSKVAPVAPETGLASPLQAFFIDALQTMQDAERQLTEALPQLQQKATNNALRTGFGKHLGETLIHVQRLQKALDFIGASVETKPCRAMQALIEEGMEQIESTPAGTALRDVALVLAAQKTEHLEIATYGGLIQLAKMLGHKEIVGLLDANMKEEYGADKLLTLVAESGVNYTAAEEGTPQAAA